MRDADIAMYVAKQQGKRTFTVFEPAEHHGLVRGLALRNDLELAMERREFTVAYQPIMDLESGRVAGVEALVRWQHPTLGELQPEEFIPLAEATGAIVPLGRWILAESCRAAATWGDAFRGAFVSVNLSVQQLAQTAFTDELRAILGETGLPPERLVLEVTESARMHGSHGPDALAALRALGVRLAIDDFGTGYAALSQLSAHRFDLVKLDASFVERLATDAGAEALVSGIAQLARTIGVELVAEGIEDGVQLARLRQAGCPLGQGFHFAPPLPEPQLRRFLASVADQASGAAARPAPRFSDG
jgi:EAL domain-containing protein (putative c-di-GMP-specific phosphodiesterase class I)